MRILALATLFLAAAGTGRAADAPIYVADFVSPAAFGVAMNDSGDVAGTSYPDTGCGSSCLPPLETVVWRGGSRIALPAVPGLQGITVLGMNAQGWVVGFAGFPYTQTHAVVWKPRGAGAYQAIDLGVLPGTSVSVATGIDDSGRVVGWSTTSNFPPNGSPFVWTESGGMLDLSALGYPDEPPLGLSPGGAVATQFNWYRLDDPGSVVPMPPPPQGFTIGADAAAINDAGDQARFLVSTSTQNPRYLFRFHHEGVWQQISFTGNFSAPYGVGSITPAGDVTATVAAAGTIAFGPDGLSQPLAALLSPAYLDADVTRAGPMNGSGQILAHVILGQSPRLMRLTPAVPCSTGCIQVPALQIQARFVPDPTDPDHCTPEASNRTRARLEVTSETGAPLGGVLVSARFLDDYWTNAPVFRRTNASGHVSFAHAGPCGVGAITFLVEGASKDGLVFDRTVGVVTGWAIPE